MRTTHLFNEPANTIRNPKLHQIQSSNLNLMETQKLKIERISVAKNTHQDFKLKKIPKDKKEKKNKMVARAKMVTVTENKVKLSQLLSFLIFVKWAGIKIIYIYIYIWNYISSIIGEEHQWPPLILTSETHPNEKPKSVERKWPLVFGKLWSGGRHKWDPQCGGGAVPDKWLV